MSRPGVLLYFDSLSGFDKLSDEQAGKLIKAVSHYASPSGSALPDFSGDLTLDVLWDMMQRRIDDDAAAYDRKIEKNKYATYCREADKNKTPRLSFEEWQAASSNDVKRYQTIPDDIQYNNNTTQYNNNTTQYNNNTTQYNNNTKTNTISNTVQERKQRGCGGKESEPPTQQEIVREAMRYGDSPSACAEAVGLYLDWSEKGFPEDWKEEIKQRFTFISL